MIQKSTAISNFLLAKTHPDLAKLYSINMECQVNVARGNGTRIEGDFRGRKWHGWTDGITTWKSFRIPFSANHSPHYTDQGMTFDLDEHAEAIGMTGWDWGRKVSKWVAFDFDLITAGKSHSKKLTNQELQEVQDAAVDITWVTVRRSTSGKGLHLYVFLDNVPTKTHTEHAALARAILGKMSALTGFDFNSKVDVCGGNMWVWRHDLDITTGLTLVKEGDVLDEIPPNWRDHIKVVSGSRSKSLPQNIDAEADFDTLSGQYPKIKLDKSHRELIEFFRNSETLWWWDQDHHMLVTHTIHLKEAFNALSLRGFFETISTGKEKGVDHNCFLFPLRSGAWVVRRYSKGCAEHTSWSQDGAGWTRCYLNKDLDLRTACRAAGGLEDAKGDFVFTTGEGAVFAAQLLGVNIEVPMYMKYRSTVLKQHKDGRLIVEIKRDPEDSKEGMENWLSTSTAKPWTKIFNIHAVSPSEPEIGNFDDMVRHIVSEAGDDRGWAIYADGWRIEPLNHVKIVLASLGLNIKDINTILGASVINCWQIVNRPFQPEFPGDRQWNYLAAQLAFAPTKDDEELSYPTWIKILSHCGEGLNDAVLKSDWAQVNGIVNGADYLKCWIASLFQNPLKPLPYLFFHGPQNSGKSIFHEAISKLITRGYKRADIALISQAGFNAELEGAVICVVEETDLNRNRNAYNRIKDWVTSRDLVVHEKGRTPYHIPNTSHWIQCANDHQACPVFAGDTRITMCFVESLPADKIVQKDDLLASLEKEAPDFLAAILKLEIPKIKDRLGVPVLATLEKQQVEEMNRSLLDIFLKAECKDSPGDMIKYSDLFERFREWLKEIQAPYEELTKWSKRSMGAAIVNLQYLKGRRRSDAQLCIGNIRFKGTPTLGQPELVLQNDFLVEKDKAI